MRVRRARQTAWRAIAGETVLLDLAGKRMYGLNPAAAYVWLALDAASGPGELLPATAGGARTAFGEGEVAAFLEELLALGLAERRPALEDAGEPAPAAQPTPAGPQAPFEEPPRVVWQEDVEQIAGTCAMFPSTSPICDQAPFS